MSDEATIRKIAPGDFGALLRIWNDSVRYDPISGGLLEEKLIHDVDIVPDGLLLCERGNEITGWGAAVYRATNRRGYIKMLCVSPEHRRKGIGTSLLQSLESFLIRRGATQVRVAESAPNYLTPGVDTRYEDALKFYAERGYEPFERAVNLETGLEKFAGYNTSALDHVRSGCHVRRASSADREAVDKLLSKHWEAWKDEVANALSNSPPTLHIALKGGEVVAFAAHAANNRETGWFGPMGTDPGMRGSGLGSELLLRCLADMAESGFCSATIPWVDPVDFYRQKVGATLSREFVRLRKDVDSDRPRHSDHSSLNDA